MVHARETEGRSGGLPLADDDMATAFGVDSFADEFKNSGSGNNSSISNFSLFLTIVLAAPVATLLALLVMDIYPMLAITLGIQKAPVVQIAPEASVERDKAGDDERFSKWVDLLNKNNKAISSAITKNNKSLVASINKQTSAVLKLANKKPAKIKIPAPEVMVVKVHTQEKFSLAYEKRKLLDLAGLDLDDPVTKGLFDTVRSKSVMKEVVSSLDNIIKASRNSNEVSSFVKANALKAKKFAIARLKVL